MKKSPIPRWPLYVADAMMFIAVLAISYPNIVLRETMSGGSVALCCFMVLCGLAMSLAPFYFEFKLEKKSLSENAKKTKENSALIFENLSALQLMIAETREASDKIEEKLAFQIAKDTDLKFEKFTEALQTLRDSVKAKIKEINSAIEALEEKSVELLANSDAETSRFDSLQESIDALKVAVETLQQNKALLETNQFSQSEIDELSNVTLEDIVIENTEQSTEVDDDIETIVAEPQQEKATEIDDFDLDQNDVAEPQIEPSEIDELEEEIEEDELAEPEESAQHTENKLSGLMSKALSNAMSTSEAVEKIISASQPQQETEQDFDAGETEFVEYDAQEQEPEFEEQTVFVEDIDIENATPAEEQIDTDALLADIDFDEEKKTPDVTEQSATESSEPSTDIIEEEKSSSQENGFLFEIEEPEKKARITKKDTVITLRALIGIGNSPYLRGDNSVLTQEKGWPMQYVEIGVWRAVIPPFEGELNFSIWKNDEQQIGEASYTIASGKKQEITI